VDGELMQGDRDRVARHLATCAECDLLAGQLTSVRRMLSSMPEVEPPRSFRLTPAMVAGPARRERPPDGSRFFFRAAQMTTAVAVMALAVVVVLDLSVGDESSNRQLAAPVASDAGGAQTSKSLNSGAPAPEGTRAAATVPPFNSGGAGAQGVTTPAATPSAPASNVSSPEVTADAYGPEPLSQSARPVTSSEAAGGASYRWAEMILGPAALASAGVTLVLWRSRRSRSDA
jgi:anti-sigma factor RsiW